MASFTDACGNRWDLSITIGTAKRVKTSLQADLLQPLDGSPPLLTRIGTDLIFLCDLLYAICQPQAESRQISDAAFAESLSGDGLRLASEALLEGLTDFFRQLGRDEVVTAIYKQAEVQGRAIELTVRTINSAAFDIEINRHLAKIPGSLSGDLPDSLVSTPSPSPSVS